MCCALALAATEYSRVYSSGLLWFKDIQIMGQVNGSPFTDHRYNYYTEQSFYNKCTKLTCVNQ